MTNAQNNGGDFTKNLLRLAPNWMLRITSWGVGVSLPLIWLPEVLEGVQPYLSHSTRGLAFYPGIILQKRRYMLHYVLLCKACTSHFLKLFFTWLIVTRTTLKPRGDPCFAALCPFPRRGQKPDGSRHIGHTWNYMGCRHGIQPQVSWLIFTKLIPRRM